MPEHDQARRFLAAARDTEHHAHLERRHARLVEDVGRQPGLRREGLSPLREHTRCQLIAGSVGEGARVVAGVTEDVSALERLAHPGAVIGDADLCGVDPGRRRTGSIGSAVEVGQAHSLGDHLRRLFGRDRGARAMDDGNARQAALACSQTTDDRHASQGVGREVLAAARTDEHNAKRLPVGRRGRRGEHVEQLADKMAPRASTQDFSARRSIQTGQVGEIVVSKRPG